MEKSAQMFAYLFKIEVFKTPITGIMKQYHDKHYSAFDMVESRWYERLFSLFSVYFAVILSKNLQKSSAIQNNSVTLSAVSIAIIVCYTFNWALKVTTIFANHQIYKQLKFIELTLILNVYLIILVDLSYTLLFSYNFITYNLYTKSKTSGK